MERDRSTEALKVFVKVVGLLLLVSVLVVVIFFGEGTRPLGYFLFAVVGFFAWRMVRIWDKSALQLYALVQSIGTAIVIGHLGNGFWPGTGNAIGGAVLLLAGPPFERFMVRYVGFAPQSPKVTRDKDSGGEIVGTPWQANPGHTAP